MQAKKTSTSKHHVESETVTIEDLYVDFETKPIEIEIDPPIRKRFYSELGQQLQKWGVKAIEIGIKKIFELIKDW
jgi:hypothetical protein